MPIFNNSAVAVERVRRQTPYDDQLEVERERRDSPPYGAPPAPSYHPAPHHTKGRVGPVYTFVKTDPQVGIWPLSLGCLTPTKLN